MYPVSFSKPDNPYRHPEHTTLNRYYYVHKPRMRTWLADQNLEGRLNWGATEHTVLFGADYSRYRETGQETSGLGSPLNVYHPVYGNAPDYDLSDTPKNKQEQLGFYAQDQIRYRNWIFLAGIRHDRAQNELEGSDSETDNATTKRFGLLYAADNGLSPYISYSESFTPIAGTDVYSNRWKPMRGKQWELGLKYMPPKRDLEATAAIYDLREKNRQVPDPSNPMNQVQAGKTKRSEEHTSELQSLMRI